MKAIYSATRRFARVYKKLTNAAGMADADAAVAAVADNPDVGEREKGQLHLLGYSREEEVRLIYLEALGPHENFYRDLKR